MARTGGSSTSRASRCGRLTSGVASTRLGYAAATAGAPAGWEERAREAFLDAYRMAAIGATFLPDNEAALVRALAILEIEKAAYEVVYEANNRPDWLPIPVRGLLNAAAGHRPDLAAGGP